MWILTDFGFYSIVRKPWNPTVLTVRARVRQDLDALNARLPKRMPIAEDDCADYRYRLTAPATAVAVTLAAAIVDIDYDNFKDAVAARQGARRAEAYHHVWHDLAALQGRPAASSTPLLTTGEIWQELGRRRRRRRRKKGAVR